MTTTYAQHIATFKDVAEERARQDTKWGVQTHSDKTWLTILVEEVGEAAKAICDGDQGKPSNLREELIQSAAVIVAWLEDMERKTEGD